MAAIYADRNSVIETLHEFMSPDGDIRSAAVERLQEYELTPSHVTLQTCHRSKLFLQYEDAPNVFIFVSSHLHNYSQQP
jgi:hypothetical protein